MHKLTRAVLGSLVALALSAPAPGYAQETTIRIAEADTFSGEDLIQLIAYENAKKRGVNIESVSLKSDDVTFQAVLNGQVDVGVGDAYEAIANLDAPIRHFYQVRKLAYIPVVDKTQYQSWEDLDGEPFAVHSRGSGTETLARIIESTNGIKFSEITYVPGSEVRVVAMQRGNIKATLLDLTTSKLLLESDPQKFGTLPAGEQVASDSAYYARTEFLEENAEAVQVLVEELLKAARAVNEDPAFAAAERERLGLLPDLPPEAAAEITPFHEQAVAAGIFPVDGGGEEAAKADIAFLTTAGKLTDPAMQDPQRFWDLGPLNAALAALGDAPAEASAQPADATEAGGEPAEAEGEPSNN
jgi:NitT/TauT family transport system substrate-binding protein